MTSETRAERRPAVRGLAVTHGRNVDANRRRMVAAIESRRDFTTGGSMYGAWIRRDVVPAVGRLPQDWAVRLYETLQGSEEGCYLVYSYGTPIAWCDAPGSAGERSWWIPEVRYSVSTTRQQGILWSALTYHGRGGITFEN